MNTAITKEDIRKIKIKWASAVVASDSASLLQLYSENAKLKPTLSNYIRDKPEEIKSYFDGDGNFNDSGFLNNNFVNVDFEDSEPQFFNNMGFDMGVYKFTDSKGETVCAHYTFIFVKSDEGHVFIKAQHSSLAI